MSIGLGNSTLGTEQSNIEELVRNIDNNLINECIRITEKDLNELVDSVDTMWTGITADEFKKKVLNDQEKFINILHDVAERMHQDIAQMSSNISNADSYIAANMGIAPMSGGSGFEPTSHYTPMDYYDIDHPKEHYSPIDDSKKGSNVEPERGGTYDWEKADQEAEWDRIFNPWLYEDEKKEEAEDFSYLPWLNGYEESDDWYDKDILSIINDNEDDAGPDGLYGSVLKTCATVTNFAYSMAEGFVSGSEHVMDATMAYVASIGYTPSLSYASPTQVNKTTASMAISYDYTSDLFKDAYGDANDPYSIMNMSYAYDTIHSAGVSAGNTASRYAGSLLLQAGGVPSPIADAMVGGVDTYGKYAQVNLQNSNLDFDRSMTASITPAIIDAGSSAAVSVMSKSIDGHLINPDGTITPESLGTFAFDQGQKTLIGYATSLGEDEFIVQPKDTTKTPNALNYDVDSRYRNTNSINIYEDKRYQTPTDKS